jgi:hypothetical protein
MRVVIILLTILISHLACAQQQLIERALEEIAEKEETEIEDDELAQQLEIFKRNPVNLNTARQEELQLLQLLNSLQVRALIQYRELFGKFIDLYELQAIPHWDLETIRRVLPYITIADPAETVSQLGKLFRNVRHGSSMLMVTLAHALGTGDTAHAGSPQRLLVRYRYNYSNLQFGILAEKDAGESLRKGFDFNSVHLFLRKAGMVKALAIGDFAVNMGQGLIHWQSLSLRKSSQVITGKRQSAVLRPYTSAGEHNFHRGAGITLQRKAVSLTAFASFRKLDANLSLVNNAPAITSFLTSGLHRTTSELAERNNISRQTFGAVLSFDQPSWHVGLNAIQHRFSNAVLKKNEPYNLFAFRGKQLANYSIHYDRTWRNVHLFGEFAATQGGKSALVQGVLASLHRKLDASLVFRHLSPGFQSVNASAFTESSIPSNESGFFLGLVIKPGRGYTINIYADVFRFPWLRFRTDAPSNGSEHLLQLAFQPDKRVELSTTLRVESKNINQRSDNEVVNSISTAFKTNWRTHINWQLSPAVRLRQRLELVWFNAKGGREQGFLIYNDVSLNPAGKPYGLSARVQFFETGGFNSRIYAFENDAGVGYAVLTAYHKGFRYYFNLDLDVLKPRSGPSSREALYIKLFLRWSQTINQMKAGRGSQGEELKNSNVYKIQLIFLKN